MGNFSMIDFDEIFDSYGININAATPEELERVKLAFESAKDMDAFVKEAKKILNPEK